MRELALGVAGRCRGHFEMFDHIRICFQISVRDELMDCLDPRTGKFRNIILAEEILIQIGRKR